VQDLRAGLACRTCVQDLRAGLAPAPRATRCSPPTSSIGLRAIAAKIQELFRSLDQPPFAQLPFFVGCRRITQAVDFLTRHFRRFGGGLGARSCPLADPKRELHEPADGFGARGIVLLRRRPAVDARKRCGRKTQGDQRTPARGRRRPLLLPSRHRSTCHGKPRYRAARGRKRAIPAFGCDGHIITNGPAASAAWRGPASYRREIWRREIEGILQA
jgi:hypothetical protein